MWYAINIYRGVLFQKTQEHGYLFSLNRGKYDKNGGVKQYWIKEKLGFGDSKTVKIITKIQSYLELTFVSKTLSLLLLELTFTTLSPIVT